MIDFNEKITELNNRLLNDPKNTNLISELAIAHLEMDEVVEAYHYFKKAAEINPSVQTLNNLGFFYFTVGLPEGPYTFNDAEHLAIEILEEAVRLNPTVHFPYTMLGELYLNNGKTAEAYKNFEKAAGIFENSNTLNNLGVSKFLQGDLEDAKKYFNNASNENVILTNLLNYGVCLAKLNDSEEARKVAEQIIKNRKEDFRVAEHDVADIFYEICDYEKVVEIYSSSQYEYSLEWVSRYLYSLNITGREELMNTFFDKVIKSVEKEIDFIIEDEDDYWIPHERLEYIYALRKEISDYKDLLAKIQAGSRPELDFVPILTQACYLFGCSRHHIPNY